MTARRRTLLRGGLVVTMDDAFTVDLGDVLIEGDRIAAVGPRAAGRKKIDEVIDCAGRLVVPGFVQPHVHLCQTLFRGGADDLELLDWLRQRIWPYEAAHTPATLRLSARLGAAELLRGGTTAILDMGTVHHTDAIFEACAELGLRATIGKAMMDAGEGVPAGLAEGTEASIEESLALAARWHGAENGRLRYAFAPRFVLSCTEALMLRVVKEARARGLGMHTHASENVNEIDAVRSICGADNVDYLHGLGMSGPDTVLAHCVHVTDHEKGVLRDTGTHVTHCPSSNLKLASGVAPIPELLRMGVNVALGADGAPCNNNLDAFVEMRLAALIHKPGGGPTAMPARDVVEMATRRGARALGLESEIGSLEAGKRADVVVVDPRKIHAAPAADPYGLLAYALHASDVEHVWVDGVPRVRRGRLIGVRVGALRSAAARVGPKLMAEARRRAV